VRVIEPYLVFESVEGDLLLHGWQRAGAFRRTPPPRWCNLRIQNIDAVKPRPERFGQPHRGYNPASTQFHRVLYACGTKRVPARDARSSHAST
jgi:hypothetical protein